MICPSCKTEYVAGISQCADCGAALVNSINEPEPPREFQWNAVGTYRDLSEAQIALAVLEGTDIPARLDNGEIVRLDWALSTAVGGIRLLVPQEHVEVATQLLSQPPSVERPAEGAEPDDEPDPVCPRCGSADVAFTNLRQKISLAGILLGLPVLWKRPGYRCVACGNTWRVTGGG